MLSKWKQALLLGLATATLAVAEQRQVNGQAAVTGAVFTGGFKAAPLYVAVDETAKVYIIVKGTSPCNGTLHFPGKDLPKAVAAVQRAVQLLNAPANAVKKGKVELGTFRKSGTDEETAEGKDTASRTAPGNRGGKQPEFDRDAFLTAMNKSREPSVSFAFEAGANRAGPFRVLHVTFQFEGRDKPAFTTMNAVQATAFLKLLRMAPPTYQALLAERKQRGGR